MSGTVLNTWNTLMNKRTFSAIVELTFWWGGVHQRLIAVIILQNECNFSLAIKCQ
jgi:hypothetical protein